MCQTVKIIWTYILRNFNMYIIFEFPRAVFELGHKPVLMC